MKVAYVNYRYRLGGIESVVRQLHQGIRLRGHRSRLWVGRERSYPFFGGVSPLYPRWASRLHFTRFGEQVERLLPYRRTADQRFRQLATSDCDLVHVHGFNNSFASWESLLWLAQHKPVVWTQHGVWIVTGGCAVPAGCNKYLSGCGACPQLEPGTRDETAQCLEEKRVWLQPCRIPMISPSRWFAEFLKQTLVGRDWEVHCIPNGVDPERYSGRRKNQPGFRRSLGLPEARLLIMISVRDFRDRNKGVELAAAALKISALSGAHLLLVGDQSDEFSSTLPPDYGRTSLGYVSEPAEMSRLLEATDIFLFPSLFENFSCAVLEAMAAECCVVAAPNDGVCEQVKADESGMIAADFTPAALAAVLSRAAQDADSRRLCGARARARVQADFGEALMIDRHLALYQQIVRNHTRACG